MLLSITDDALAVLDAARQFTAMLDGKSEVEAAAFRIHDESVFDAVTGGLVDTITPEIRAAIDAQFVAQGRRRR